MSDEISFKDKAINYLQDRGILVGKIEESSDTSFVFHVAPADREKVTGDFKAEMEAELNAYVEPSDMGGFSVVIVEAKESEEEDEETTEEVDTTEESASDSEDSETEVETEVETAKYRITGLVDYTDEQGNIVGQLPKDSIQELPTVVGDRAVEQGQAEKVVE